jgi:hypothetical protein
VARLDTFLDTSACRGGGSCPCAVPITSFGGPLLAPASAVVFACSLSCTVSSRVGRFLLLIAALCKQGGDGVWPEDSLLSSVKSSMDVWSDASGLLRSERSARAPCTYVCSTRQREAMQWAYVPDVRHARVPSCCVIRDGCCVVLKQMHPCSLQLA